MLRTLAATRYAVPLREGGSLPAIVDVTDRESDRPSEGLFVVKFKGAGQGARALIAELIVGLLAQRLELPTPELALVELDRSFGRTERDPEIQDILKGSVGLNVGMRYLDGAFNFNPVAHADLVSSELAADIVWLDAFTTNIDRTARNPNIMIHDRQPWMIDHGAALYFHHDWPNATEEKARRPFSQIADHVLLGMAGDIASADKRLAPRVTTDVLGALLAQLPGELLMHAPPGTTPAFEDAETNRSAYLAYLSNRILGPRSFVTEAIEAQARLPRLQGDQPQTLNYRR